jgi:hypothetical protein
LEPNPSPLDQIKEKILYKLDFSLPSSAQKAIAGISSGQDHHA